MLTRIKNKIKGVTSNWSQKAKNVRSALGIWASILTGVVGIGFSVYLGVWVMLIGGIARAADAFQQNPVNGYDVAVNIVGAIFFELPLVLGIWLSIILAAFVGYIVSGSK